MIVALPNSRFMLMTSLSKIITKGFGYMTNQGQLTILGCLRRYSNYMDAAGKYFFLHYKSSDLYFHFNNITTLK